MTITDNERKVLRALLTNDFANPGNRDYCTWANCVNDASEPSGITGKALGGVVRSLQEKDLALCSGRGSEGTIELTRLGVYEAKRRQFNIIKRLGNGSLSLRMQIEDIAKQAGDHREAYNFIVSKGMDNGLSTVQLHDWIDAGLGDK